MSQENARHLFAKSTRMFLIDTLFYVKMGYVKLFSGKVLVMIRIALLQTDWMRCPLHIILPYHWPSQENQDIRAPCFLS